MLPTPDTSHVPYERVYEPAEDSFLLLDTLSSATETAWLRSRFSPSSSSSASTPCPPPFVVEIGPGSGVVIAFVNAHAGALFGSGSGQEPEAGAGAAVLTAAVDINTHACRATGETVRRAAADVAGEGAGSYLGASRGDLSAPLRDGSVDVLIFNPPYVPTPEMPQPPPRASQPRRRRRSHNCYHTAAAESSSEEAPDNQHHDAASGQDDQPEEEGGEEEEEEIADGFEGDSYLLALSYAGGRDGMETTDRLLADLPRVLAAPRGCAYVLLCAGNRPEEVKRRVRDGWYWDGDGDAGGGGCWRAETVGSSGKTAGWEKLQIVRIWRDLDCDPEEGGAE